MATSYSPKIITDGLAFMYDTNDSKSYRGEPTINYIHGENAVPKDSYSTYSATSSGTYNDKHPNAIIAYNAAGSQLSGYYNSGVGDATNTYHAHWQYDPILKKPVVVMNDLVSGQWKAKWMGTGLGSWNSQGKSHGDTYTISWLQWVDHLSKNAKAGLYVYNTSGSRGFYDGQANSASSYNTKLRTWQRVYQTYTTHSSRDLSQTLASIYMYGHYNVRGTVKVADVQFTWGSHAAQFSSTYERTATQGLIDRTGTSTIDISNVSFNSNAQMTFDGTDDYLDCGDIGISSSKVTFAAWIKFSGSSTEHIIDASGNACHLSILSGNKPYFYNGSTYHTGADTITNGVWYYLTGVQSDTNDIYINGVLSNSINSNVNISVSTVNIGRWQNGGRYFNGDIASAQIYNRALTAAEVLQNYNATKGRFI